MADKIDAINALIDEAQQLQEAVSAIQGPNAPEQETIAWIQNRYSQWFHRAYALMADDFFKRRFWEPYDGPQAVNAIERLNSPSIRKFITDPLAKERPFNAASFVGIARAGGGASRPKPEDRELVWSYPYARYFDPLFKIQIQVLRETRDYIAARYESQSIVPAASPSLAQYKLHPKIVEVAANRFASGEYDDAIANSIIAVNEAVRQKSGSSANDGQALMKHAFSANNPLLRLSTDAQEQRAFMELFSAAWSAVRSPRAHSTTAKVTDPERAIELIAFASALMYLVDDAEMTRPA